MRTIILLSALLGGCALQPHTLETNAPEYVPEAVVDNNCLVMAKYARAVALLRDLNMKMDNIDNMLVKPPFSYNAVPLQSVVYATKNNPAHTSTKIYMECVSEGYANVLTRYTIEHNMQLVLTTGESK